MQKQKELQTCVEERFYHLENDSAYRLCLINNKSRQLVKSNTSNNKVTNIWRGFLGADKSPEIEETLQSCLTAISLQLWAGWLT